MVNDFTHIDIENGKVKCIIKAALEVFSQNDYEKASTNMIVKKAGIARGVLYYYFKNKEELFEFLFYYSGKVFVRDMEKLIDWNDTDYLNRIKSIVLSKADIVSEYPYITEFITKSYKDYLPIELTSFSDNEVKFRKKSLEYNLDFSSIKKEVDIEMFKKLVYYSVDGEIKSVLNASGFQALSSKRDEIIKTIDHQIDFYRKHFYI
jgi:AcrR family transcriptional regulator